MADKAPKWDLGEFRDDGVSSCELRDVEITGVAADGDILKITGSTEAGRSKVAKHTASLATGRYVVPKNQGAGTAAATAVIRQVLYRGFIKVNYGGNIDAGERIKAKGAKVVAHDDAGGNDCGWAVHAGADGDQGVVYFEGGM